MNISIRYKDLNNGRKSIYLDFTYGGKRQFEFLKLYLEPADDPKTRKINSITMEIAESVRAKRLLDLQHRVHGLPPLPKPNQDFLAYLEKKSFLRAQTGKNAGTWRSVVKHLNIFSRGLVTFSMLDEPWMERFKEYLEKTLSPNSAFSYFNVVKHAIHDAIRDQIIRGSTALLVKAPSQEETHRVHLTKKELQAMIDVDCDRPLIRKAFLLSCLAGLRFSDLQCLTWGQIQEREDGWVIVFKQKKTNGMEYLPINEETIKFLEPRGGDEERVFPGLKYNTSNNYILARWALLGGVRKHITWHVGRHTNACLLLEAGVDIYTVSKLLGHRELRTTQIYAKVVDSTKRKAVNMLPVLGIN